MSAHGEDDQRLVVEAVDAADPGDLAVRVEAGDRRSGRVFGDHVNLAADAGVAEYPPTGDAVECEQSQWRGSVERLQRGAAGGVGGVEYGIPVALGEPDQSTLWHVGDAA